MNNYFDILRYLPEESRPDYRNEKAALVTENGCYFISLIDQRTDEKSKNKLEDYILQHIPTNVQIYYAMGPENIKNLYKNFINSIQGHIEKTSKHEKHQNNLFGYKKIIFHDPATVVLWNDGTKTVVKCQNGETFDKKKGIALCFMKRALGNKNNFNDIIKKAIKKET